MALPEKKKSCLCPMLKRILSKKYAFCSSKLPSRKLAPRIRGSCRSLQRASEQQGAAQHAPRDQEKMQVNAGHSASQYQWKTRDAIMSNEELEDLIESIPYHDQIIHSIQGMMPHGLEVTS